MIDVFSLPEITIEIVPYLSRNEFRNCALVNSSWHNTFTPFLWENILSTLSYIPDGQTYTLNHINEGGFFKYNKFIHSLRSNNFLLLTVALKYCANLRHVFIPDYPRSPNSVGNFPRDVMIPGMRRNANIETLVYKTSPSSFSSDWDITRSLLDILSPLQSLRYLHLEIDSTVKYDLLIYLSRLSNLYTLRMCFQSFIHEPYPNDTQLCTEKTNLRELELKQKFGRSCTYLIPFIRSSPHLIKITLPCYDPPTFTTIAVLIRKTCSKLTSIILNNNTSTPVEDASISEIINLSPTGLRTLSTPWPVASDLSIHALCRQSLTLDSVFISNSHEGVFGIVQKLLALCPNLRVLDACSGDRNSCIENEKPLKALFMDPWASLRLEVLKVPIENVFGKYDSKTWAYDCHDIFYNQISKLEQLRELKVGYNTQTEKPSRNGPKFSLQSGLHILGKLKKLKVLCVAGMNHKIQRKELEWMCENWPRFERIYGMSSVKIIEWWSPTGDSRGFYPELIPAKVRSILKPKLLSVESFYE